jgi:hypothetical protein
MVCLPFSRMKKSWQCRWSASAGSLVPVARSSSTIIGTMTSGQPSRIRLKVPSKSKTTCRNRAPAGTSRTISTEVPGKRRERTSPVTVRW